MADMMADINKFKTKTNSSHVPVDTIYNTGMRNEMDLNNSDPVSMDDWQARERQWKKSHEWREFIQDGCIEPKE